MASRRDRLAARRRAVGYSQERLAEAVGVERTTVVRWERGETDPQPWSRPRIAQVLQISVDQLDELLTVSTGSEHRSANRLGYTLRHPDSVDVVTVAQLRQQVQALDQRYTCEPSTSLLAHTGQCLGQVGFLAEHVQDGRVRRELCTVEAEAAILMGQLVWDASQRRDHRMARAYFDQAITAARQVGDRAAEGLALLRKSFVALYGERDPAAGLSLTLQTVAITDQTSHVLAGMAVLHLAEAHAMLGERSECERALTDAEGFFNRIDSDDVAINLFSPTQFGRLAGSCYLFLGEAKRAELILAETARELQDGSKAQAIVLGNLALAYVRQGLLDEAAARLHDAMDIIEVTWGGGGLNVVFRACRELDRSHHEPAVRHVHDRLLSLMAVA